MIKLFIKQQKKRQFSRPGRKLFAGTFGGLRKFGPGTVSYSISSYIFFPGLTPDLCITCESSNKS